MEQPKWKEMKHLQKNIRMYKEFATTWPCSRAFAGRFLQRPMPNDVEIAEYYIKSDSIMYSTKVLRIIMNQNRSLLLHTRASSTTVANKKQLTSTPEIDSAGLAQKASSTESFKPQKALSTESFKPPMMMHSS
jgi:hypothetical protein